MIDLLNTQRFTVHQNGKQQVSEVFKYIGPGIIVTVGFIDPGNWAANLAAGASYGYELLWVVTLSTIMLILLQHNVAHLGIVRGQCLSECAYEFLPRYVSRFVLSTAGIAAAATALAEFIENAIWHSSFDRQCFDGSYLYHYAHNKLLSEARAYHCRIRIPHCLGVPRRGQYGQCRLGGSWYRLGRS